MKKTLAYGIVAFWFFMAALFVRREVIPDLFAWAPHGYAAARAYAQTHPSYRMGIYSPQAARIGYTETTYHPQADGTLEIASHASVYLEKRSLFGFALDGHDADGRTQFELWSDVVVAPDNTLKSFRVQCTLGVDSATASGVVEDGSLRITLDTKGRQKEEIIPLSEGDVLLSGLTAAGGMPDLRVGRSWRFKTLDPFTLRLNTASANVKRKTRLRLRSRNDPGDPGEWYSVYEVELRTGAAVARVWVSTSGDVLREEAFGFVMEREPLPHETARKSAGTPTTEPARN